MVARQSPWPTRLSAGRFALVAAGALLGVALPRPLAGPRGPLEAVTSSPRWIGAGVSQARAEGLPQRLFLPSLAAPGVTLFMGIAKEQVGGAVGPMVLRDDRIYVAEGRGLSTYAIGSGSAPRRLAFNGPLDERVVDLTAQGTHLFVRTAGSQDHPYGLVHRFDLVSETVDGGLKKLPDEAWYQAVYDLSFHGSTAYLCDASGLRVLDAGDPSQPTPLGSLPVPDGLTDCQRSDSGLLLARCVGKCGNTAAAAPKGQLWRAVDVRDPANPRIVRELGDDWVPGGPAMSGYLLAGDRLYIESVSHGTGQSFGRLQAFEVGDPLDWRAGGSLGANPLEACAGFGPAVGKRVFAGGRKTCVYDWSDPMATTPRLEATLESPSELRAAEGNVLAVIGGHDLRVFDGTEEDWHRELGVVGLLESPSWVAAGGAMSVAVTGNRLSLLDAARSGAGQVSATWDAPPHHDADFVPIAPSIDHRLSGRRLPVYDGQDLQVVDLDASGSPLAATSLRLFDDPAPGVLAAQGTLVLVAARDSSGRAATKAAGIVVVQVDPSGAPRAIGRVDLAQMASGNPSIRFTSAHIAGDRAYLTTAQPSTLAIVDLREPTTPVVRRWLPLDGALSAVAVRGSVAYVAAGDAGVKVVRVAIPEEAVLIDTRRAGQAVDLIEAEGPKFPVLYVADAQGKLWLFDIGDPERPKPYTHALIDGEVQGISVAADDPRADVCVAAGSGGLLRFAWLVSALP